MFKTGDIVWYENKYWEITDLSPIIQQFQFKNVVSICSLSEKPGEITIALTKSSSLKKVNMNEYLAMKILDS